MTLCYISSELCEDDFSSLFIVKEFIVDVWESRNLDYMVKMW